MADKVVKPKKPTKEELLLAYEKQQKLKIINNNNQKNYQRNKKLAGLNVKDCEDKINKLQQDIQDLEDLIYIIEDERKKDGKVIEDLVEAVTILQNLRNN